MADPYVSQFPGLSRGDAVTSVDTPRYNCIAWAAGDTSHWWWPERYGFWPGGVPAELTLDAFIKLYEFLGHDTCAGGALEEGFEKVAIYTNAKGVPTHAARQLPSGWWTSKLGRSVDIEHTNADSVSGSSYGKPAVYLKRRQAQ